MSSGVTRKFASTPPPPLSQKLSSFFDFFSILRVQITSGNITRWSENYRPSPPAHQRGPRALGNATGCVPCGRPTRAVVRRILVETVQPTGKKNALRPPLLFYYHSDYGILYKRVFFFSIKPAVAPNTKKNGFIQPTHVEHFGRHTRTHRFFQIIS